ncbi:MAG: hypothetical protein FWE00_11845, partial [Defluviitaleaceae bacterium]|nr:hypothetical protein [Defluviitaleaceae bacterium]
TDPPEDPGQGDQGGPESNFIPDLNTHNPPAPNFNQIPFVTNETQITENPDNTFTLTLEDGTQVFAAPSENENVFFLYDALGVPMGTLTFNPETNEWVFDMPTPMGTLLPETGELNITIALLFSGLGLITLGIAVRHGKKRAA